GSERGAARDDERVVSPAPHGVLAIVDPDDRLAGPDLGRGDRDRLDLPAVDVLAEVGPWDAIPDEPLEGYGVEKPGQTLRDGSLGRPLARTAEAEEAERDADHVAHPDVVDAADLEGMPDLDQTAPRAGLPERGRDEAGVDRAATRAGDDLEADRMAQAPR